MNVRTSHSGRTITRTESISPSSLEQLLGLSRCAEWVEQLNSIELNETESQTLAMVRDALARHAQDGATDERIG